MATNPPTAHHGHGWVLLIANPWLMGAFAVITLGVWYLATQFSMNTSEVFFMVIAFGQAVTGASAGVHFAIPQQIGDLFAGNGTQHQLMSEAYGLLLEAVNLVMAIGGVSFALQVIQKGSPALIASTAKESMHRHRAFFGFTLALLGFDIYSSATYGSASTAGAMLFAVLLQFVAFFFLPLGVMFLRAAWILRK